MCLSACCPAENKPHNRAEEEKKAAEDKKESKFDPKELLAVSVYNVNHISYFGQSSM